MQNRLKWMGWVVMIAALICAAYAVLQMGVAAFVYADPPPPPGVIGRAYSGAIGFTALSAVLMLLSVLLLKSTRNKSAVPE